MEGLTLEGKPDLAALGATRVGPCRLRADLWDTGLGYPALTRPGEETAGEVLGELWQLADPAVALAALDAFESLYDGDEAGSDYLRRRVRCTEPAGAEAWLYVWNGPTEGMTPVAGGDWRAWLAAGGGAGAGGATA